MWVAISALVPAIALIAAWAWRRRDKSIALIEYSIGRSTPIKVGSEMIGAFILKVRCKARIAEDVTVYLTTGHAPIELQEADVPTGLQYTFSKEDEHAHIFIPNFQVGDDLDFVLQSRGYFVPQVMKVVIRAPKEVRIRQIGTEVGLFARAKYMPFLIIVAGMLAIVGMVCTFVLIRTRMVIPFDTARDVTRVVQVESAADAGLDSLVTEYIRSSDPQYYSAADIAISRTNIEKSSLEQEKYRKFLSLVLQRAQGISAESKAHLFYGRSKIEAEMGKFPEATVDLQASKNLDPRWIDEKIAEDPVMRSLPKP